MVGWALPWATGALCANPVEADAIRRVATTTIFRLVMVISIGMVVSMTTSASEIGHLFLRV